jgi:hypothetical protein
MGCYRPAADRALQPVSSHPCQSSAMSRDLQNVIGGILLVISLGVLDWCYFKTGYSCGPFPIFKFWGGDRETDPRSFWLNIMYSACLMAVFLGIATFSLSKL